MLADPLMALIVLYETCATNRSPDPDRPPVRKPEGALAMESTQDAQSAQTADVRAGFEIVLPSIAEDAIQAAFKTIADRLAAYGYPVTGDLSPGEVLEIERRFAGYVRAMAHNNPALAAAFGDNEYPARSSRFTSPDPLQRRADQIHAADVAADANADLARTYYGTNDTQATP